MWAEVQHHLLLSLTQNHRVGEGRETRSNFDGSTTSIVHDTILERPSVNVPYPACERAVDECGPAEGENHCWNDATSFSDSTHDDSSRDSTELHLFKESVCSMMMMTTNRRDRARLSLPGRKHREAQEQVGNLGMERPQHSSIQQHPCCR